MICICNCISKVGFAFSNLRNHTYHPAGLVVDDLDAKVDRGAGAGDPVAEALSAPVRVRRLQSKVAGLAPVTPGSYGKLNDYIA